ncbi:MAG: hypothetical protein GY705_22095 [Bacteroidetes bacterium]|nr:hypothetical protein [Bacteroidota bacterium]
MNHDIIFDKCNFDDPVSVVSAFIVVMNRWEIHSWKSMRAVRNSNDPSSYQNSSIQLMEEIFSFYCNKKERKYGRLGTFQNPPEYNPDAEKVISKVIEGKKAVVETERDAILGGGRYQYVLYRKDNNWLIDNLKHQYKEQWEKAIL